MNRKELIEIGKKLYDESTKDLLLTHGIKVENPDPSTDETYYQYGLQWEQNFAKVSEEIDELHNRKRKEWNSMSNEEKWEYFRMHEIPSDII